MKKNTLIIIGIGLFLIPTLEAMVAKKTVTFLNNTKEKLNIHINGESSFTLEPVNSLNNLYTVPLEEKNKKFIDTLTINDDLFTSENPVIQIQNAQIKAAHPTAVIVIDDNLSILDLYYGILRGE